jgi:protein gp37
MAPEWVENFRAVSQDQNVAFFFKQWGGTHKGRNGRLLDGRTWDEYPPAVASGRIASANSAGSR